jgi:cytochrome d ubiquinol oxidase subunit II
VLVAVGLAAVIVLPGFVLLYVLDQRGLLPEEGVEDAGDRPLNRSPVDQVRRPTDR